MIWFLKCLNPNSLGNKGSCWILKDCYCSVTMLRELGLKGQYRYDQSSFDRAWNLCPSFRWLKIIPYECTSGVTMGGGRGEGARGTYPPSRGLCSPSPFRFWKNMSPFEAARYKMFKFWHAPLEKVVQPLVLPPPPPPPKIGPKLRHWSARWPW